MTWKCLLAGLLIIIWGAVWYEQNTAQKEIHAQGTPGETTECYTDPEGTLRDGHITTTSGPGRYSAGACSSTEDYKRIPPQVAASRGGTHRSKTENTPSTAGDIPSASVSDHSGECPTVVFKITAYTAGPESTGKVAGDPGYGITATGAPVTAGRTIATDWDILPPGTVVEIEGLGRRVVEDRGGAVKGNHIDMYVPGVTEAIEWGVRHLEVKIISGGN